MSNKYFEIGDYIPILNISTRAQFAHIHLAIVTTYNPTFLAASIITDAELTFKLSVRAKT
jgi:hypothetical protein